MYLLFLSSLAIGQGTNSIYSLAPYYIVLLLEILQARFKLKAILIHQKRNIFEVAANLSFQISIAFRRDVLPIQNNVERNSCARKLF